MSFRGLKRNPRHILNGYGMDGALRMFHNWLSPKWYLQKAKEFEAAGDRARLACLELGYGHKRANDAKASWLQKAEFCYRRAYGHEPMPKVLFIGR